MPPPFHATIPTLLPSPMPYSSKIVSLSPALTLLTTTQTRSLTIQAIKPKPKPSLLYTLFAESNTSPSPPYKPHKVYGYPTSKQIETSRARAARHETEILETLESNRRRELRRLKLATLGNNIDGTNFCTKYQGKGEGGAVKAPASMVSDAVREVEDGREVMIPRSAVARPTASAVDWLVREGFREALTPPPAPTIARDVRQSLHQENIQPPLQPQQQIRREPLIPSATSQTLHRGIVQPQPQPQPQSPLQQQPQNQSQSSIKFSSTTQSRSQSPKPERITTRARRRIWRMFLTGLTTGGTLVAIGHLKEW